MEETACTPKKSMGRPKSQEKKKTIIEAATQIFLEKGYTNTSMDAVANAAGVSKQTVYSHFQNKENLFREVVIFKSDEFAPSPELLEQKGLSVEEVLKEFARGFLELVYCYECVAMHRIIIEEAVRNPKVAQLFFEAGPMRVKETFSNYLQQQTEKGLLKVSDPLLAAGHFFSLLKDMRHLAVLMNVAPELTPEEREVHVEQVIEIFLKLYGT